jgi:nucleoside-diphosphate-sugar epimerase
MANAIIGSNGFIGSRLQWYADTYLDEEWIGINRDNYNMWKGTRFKTLVWAGGTAVKQTPDYEMMKANVTGLLDAITDFPARKMVYISSQAVYEGYEQFKKSEPRGCSYHEEMFLPPLNMSRYGQSKVLGEYIVKNSYDRWLILRPNGFVGPGLKKNVIFSLAKNPPELYYSWDSRLQIIHTDIFAAVSFMLASSYSNEIFNVALPEVITPVYVAAAMGVDIKAAVQPKDRVVPRVNAVIDTTKLETVLEGGLIALPSAEEAIRKWNEPFGIKIPMFGMRDSVGESGNRG